MKNELIRKLTDERFILSKKIERLEKFLEEEHTDISKYHLDLLHLQYNKMIDYHHILCARIIDLLQENKNDFKKE